MEQKEGITQDQDGLLNPTPHEDIQAAALAMGVIEDMDALLLDEQDAKMVMAIRKMALVITYQALFEIHEGNWYGSENH